MPQPPVLPEVKVARAARLGHLHGTCVLYVAGVFALLSAMTGDYLGAVVGLLVAGAGAIEHHGAALLHEAEPRGISWLVASQLFLLFAIAAYCAVQLFRFEPPVIPETLRPALEINAAQFNLTPEAFVAILYRILYWALLFGSVVYQGGLALYYLSRRHAVAQLMADE